MKLNEKQRNAVNLCVKVAEGSNKVLRIQTLQSLEELGISGPNDDARNKITVRKNDLHHGQDDDECKDGKCMELTEVLRSYTLGEHFGPPTVYFIAWDIPGGQRVYIKRNDPRLQVKVLSVVNAGPNAWFDFDGVDAYATLENIWGDDDFETDAGDFESELPDLTTNHQPDRYELVSQNFDAAMEHSEVGVGAVVLIVCLLSAIYKIVKYMRPRTIRRRIMHPGTVLIAQNETMDVDWADAV